MRRIGRQLVIKPADLAAHRGDEETRNPLRDAGFRMVEMRRLELLPPYMPKQAHASQRAPIENQQKWRCYMRFPQAAFP
jgi:hypothetical protein